MDYNFFDYKYNIVYNGEDFFGPLHIAYIITSIIVIILLTNHLRKKDKKIIDKILLYSAIFLTIEEITKISWESYWDINTGHGFNVGGILPLETCSIFMKTAIGIGLVITQLLDLSDGNLYPYGMEINGI